ncbi:MAG: hypothetical protein HXS52_12815 [Theionarchaea archaeon]|nr:hypothetical protein [Theionarchaea archaeon]MBU7038806.1 hypothetical protein [Theionarchaea archaeon]
MEKSISEDNLREMEQKAYRESMQDGLTEIFLGILLIGMGTLFAVKISAAFAVLFMLFAPRILEKLKRKYTYPRMGYMKLHSDPPGKTARGIFSYMLLVVIVMATVVFIVFGDFSADMLYRLTPTFMGAMLAGALTYLVGKSGDHRYYGIAVFGLVAGIVLSIYRFESMWTGLVVYFFLMGSCFTGLGVVRFSYFLQKYPIQEEVTDE